MFIYHIILHNEETTPHSPSLGRGVGGLGRCLVEPCWGLLRSKLVI